MTRAAVLTLCLVAALSVSCRKQERKAAASERVLPALSATSPVTALAVPGAPEAVVALPVGATRPAPVVVAVLGIGDTPESQCATWRELVEGRAFVLCPRGVPHWVQDEVDASAESTATGQTGDEDGAPAPPIVPGPPRQVGFYHPDLEALEREVDAGMAALRARWGDYVAQDGAIYAGFSRGAFLGASLVAKQPARFKRAILIEGGQTPWSEDVAARFASGGGERVLFACGQPSCVDEATPASAILRRRKIEARVVHGQGEGHGYKHQVKDEVRRNLEWVVDGDPRWRQLFADRAAYK